MKLAITEVLRGRQARAAPKLEISALSSGPSTRVRILGWYVALLAVALLLGLFLQRAVLRSELSGEINQQLRQEVDELQQLSGGRDPQTGQPFGNDVEAIFDTFLRRNIPVEGEALFTLVDGKPYASTVTPLQLLDDPEVVATWAAVTSPVQTEIETDAGLVRYLAVPVLPDQGHGGVFVVAIFMDPEFAEVDRVLQTGGVVFISVFVVASIIAWFAAGRILRPVRLLTETANSISESNWTQRIPVSGRDEIASLTRTFNAMLDRLQESFTTQRRFLDDAGHELRTPITIIRGHLEVMGDNPEEKEEVKLLVLDELERMSRIVDDLLLLARAEQTGFLDVRPLDVSELTDEIVAKAVGLGPPRPWLLDEKAYIVMRGDRHRLTQALMNLVRNAIEHSPEGSQIAVGSREVGNQVQFWVRDYGEGIPTDERERIFDRFVRGKVGHGPTDGAGLGLSIVKAIVESHGGTVRVNSKLGSGSTFTIAVPVAGPPDAQ